MPGLNTDFCYQPRDPDEKRKKRGLTGEVLDWPERKTVKLRVSRKFKKELNKKG